MAYTLYRTLTHLLWPLALAASRMRGGAGRAEWRERLGRMPDATEGALWLHAASVGEVAAVSPLVRALSDETADTVVTVVTPTGHALASRTLAGAKVAFAPLDFVPAVRSALSLLRPRALLIAETELWPNTIRETSAAGVEVGLVNGRLSEASLRRYRMPLSPLRELVGLISFVAARSEDDASRFRELGVGGSRVHVVGDMKFDKLGSPLGQDERRRLAAGLGVPPGSPVVVFGSVRPREEEAVAAAAADVLDRFPDARVVVAPRHLERVERVLESLSARGVSGRTRSSGAGSERAIVLDTTGELRDVYAVGTVAFVGGTLAPYGGHDPLEPAAQGVPVVIGTHTDSCADSAEHLLSCGGAFRVSTAEELAGRIVGLLEDATAREEAAKGAARCLEEGRGATQRTVELLRDVGVLDGASD